MRQHGWAKRRTWRKLHLGVDESTGEVHALDVTAARVGDAAHLPTLLAQVAAPLCQVTGDGAYATWNAYDAVAARRAARGTAPARRLPPAARASSRAAARALPAAGLAAPPPHLGRLPAPHPAARQLHGPAPRARRARARDPARRPAAVEAGGRLPPAQPCRDGRLPLQAGLRRSPECAHARGRTGRGARERGEAQPDDDLGMPNRYAITV